MKDRPFTRNFRLYLIIPVVIVVLAAALTLAGQGMNLGIDFVGGSVVHYNLKTAFETGDIEGIVRGAGALDYRIEKSGKAASETEAQIFLGGVKADASLAEGIKAAIAAKYEDAKLIAATDIQNSAEMGLLLRASLAALAVLACALVYIGLRLGFYAGLATFFTLLHDCLITWALVVFLKRVCYVNVPTAAALFAVIAFSVNNAVILLYRVREIGGLAKNARAAKAEIAEKSISKIMPRTVSIALIAVLALIAAYILGANSVRQFVLPLMAGVLASTYSSLLLCGPIWAFFAGRKKA